MQPEDVPPRSMDRYKELLRRAYKTALDSPDPSTQNGAVVLDWRGIVIGSASNTFTTGVMREPHRLVRPAKYSYIEHAERMSLFRAARYGGQPHTLVAVWAACAECARAIVEMGICVLVRHAREDLTGRWAESIVIGDEIMRAGDVKIVEIQGALGDCDPVLFDGQLVSP